MTASHWRTTDDTRANTCVEPSDTWEDTGMSEKGSMCILESVALSECPLSQYYFHNTFQALLMQNARD